MNYLSKLFILPVLSSVTIHAAELPVEFGGLSVAPVIDIPSKYTGLDAIYVVPSTADVSMTFTTDGHTPVSWAIFGQTGSAYAEDIDNAITDQRGSTLSQIKGNFGYVISYGGRTYYIWIVDYSYYKLQLSSISVDDQLSDCARVMLDVTGEITPIDYYSINGNRQELSRDLKLDYSSLVYDKSADNYTTTQVEVNVEDCSEKIVVPMPLCPTEFVLTGDRFLSAWNMPVETVSSPMYDPIGVDLTTVMLDESGDEVNSIEGEAPCPVTLLARVTDAALFHEWQIARDSEFADIYYTSDDLETSYTFRESGNFYVRMVVANADGSCEKTGTVFEIALSESSLKCPNAFSPQASPGVNDEWRVSARSIVEFDCQIFNRWGVMIAQLTSPDVGWDGRYKGKYVPSGVYYYTIKARGGDGKSYNLKGDINIINQRAGSILNGSGQN